MKQPQRHRALLTGLVALLACAPPPGDEEPANGRAGGDREADAAGSAPAPPQVRVRSGIEVLLEDSLHLVRDRRVGLVTNHTGIFRVRGQEVTGIGGAADTIRSSIDALFEHAEVDLVALYGPEHGLPGTAAEGEQVPSGRHEGTDLPVYSLYGSSYRPLPHMLEGVDVLLFDIQDIGARYYTYVYTMALAMEAAGEAGIPFVVLDRPNPIDGVRVQGNVLEPAFSSFVGMYPLPMRHGMTPGELARLFRGEFGVDVDLTVVPAAGWERGMRYGATGLPWVAPSPNMPSVESALHYPGTCLFEGTPLSVGRGTERAFQWIGAPWLDGPALAERLNARDLPGVRFEAVTFHPREPSDGKFGGEVVHGVRFVATDPAVYNPTMAGVAALLDARDLAGDRWSWREDHFDRLAGTDRLRAMIEEGRSLDTITAEWQQPLEAFRALRGTYLIYGEGR